MSAMVWRANVLKTILKSSTCISRFGAKLQGLNGSISYVSSHVLNSPSLHIVKSHLHATGVLLDFK